MVVYSRRGSHFRIRLSHRSDSLFLIRGLLLRLLRIIRESRQLITNDISCRLNTLAVEISKGFRDLGGPCWLLLYCMLRVMMTHLWLILRQEVIPVLVEFGYKVFAICINQIHDNILFITILSLGYLG